MLKQSDIDKIVADQYLSTAPLRLSFNGSDGYPRVVSLWFQYQQGAFYCVTHKYAWVLQQLEKNHQVGFDISTNAPPYKGVRGIGNTQVQPLTNNILGQLIENYLGNSDSQFAKWLLSRQQDERVIKIIPAKISSWNYSERMQGSVSAG